jgi:hypothetical protein
MLGEVAQGNEFARGFQFEFKNGGALLGFLKILDGARAARKISQLPLTIYKGYDLGMLPWLNVANEAVATIKNLIES